MTDANSRIAAPAALEEPAGEMRVDWGMEAVACELFAVSLRYPDASLVEIVSSGEWAQALREVFEALKISLPAGWEDELGSFGLSDVRAEATRLFVGSPKPACSPYEAYWRAQDDGVAPLMFVNPHTVEVERFVRACGLARSGGANEPVDHLSVEFEFLQYLALVEAGVTFEDLREVSFPCGRASAAFASFAAEHPLSFVPRFATRLQEGSRLGFYRVLGAALERYAAHLAAIVGSLG